MYDIGSEKLSRLRGELSNTFVEVAESNAQSQELEGLSDTEGAASAISPARLPAPTGFEVTFCLLQVSAKCDSDFNITITSKT